MHSTLEYWRTEVNKNTRELHGNGMCMCAYKSSYPDLKSNALLDPQNLSLSPVVQTIGSQVVAQVAYTSSHRKMQIQSSSGSLSHSGRESLSFFQSHPFSAQSATSNMTGYSVPCMAHHETSFKSLQNRQDHWVWFWDAYWLNRRGTKRQINTYFIEFYSVWCNVGDCRRERETLRSYSTHWSRE